MAGGYKTVEGFCPKPGWDVVNIPALSATILNPGVHAFSAVKTLPKPIDTTYNNPLFRYLSKHLLAPGYTINVGGKGNIVLQGLVNGIWQNLLITTLDDQGYYYSFTGGTLVGSITAFRVAAAFSILSAFAGTGAKNFSGDGGLAVNATLNQPVGLAQLSGQTYIADSGNNCVRLVDTFGGISTVAGAVVGNVTLNNPTALAFDSAGNLYIADTGSHTVYKMDNGGVVTHFAGSGLPGYGGDGGLSQNSDLHSPMGVAVDSLDNVWISDTGNNVIRMCDHATGLINTLVGFYPGTAGFSGDGGLATAALLNGPRGLTFDAAGNLYLTDTNNNCVRMVDVTGSTNISTITGTPPTPGYSGDGGNPILAALRAPAAIAFDVAGKWYIADTGNNVVRTNYGGAGNMNTLLGFYPGVAAFAGNGTAGLDAHLNQPSGILVDASNNIFVSDTLNNQVRTELVTSGGISGGYPALQFIVPRGRQRNSWTV